MRVLAINGGPRKSGHTVELLDVALKAVGRASAETKLVHLADYDIRRCCGCYACSASGCPQRDDMDRLLAELKQFQGDGILYGAPVFNFNLPGLLVDFWNRKTGMSGYFRARKEGRINEWLAENRSWKVGAGITQAGHSGGQRTALKHINFALLSEADRVLPGVAGHTNRWDRALADSAQLGSQVVRMLERGRRPYRLWQLPFVYKRRTCFEFPAP